MASESGERTRLTCSLRRLAAMLRKGKFVMARAPSPAREARALPGGLLRQKLLHRDKLERYTSGIIINPFRGDVSAGVIEFHSRQGGHQFKRYETAAGRFGFAPIQNGARDSSAGVIGMNEERANFRRVRFRIKQASVAAGKLIATEKSFTFAPATAANQLSVRFRNEIGAISDECAVDAEDVRQRRSDLFIAIMRAAQFSRRDRD